MNPDPSAGQYPSQGNTRVNFFEENNQTKCRSRCYEVNSNHDIFASSNSTSNRDTSEDEDIIRPAIQVFCSNVGRISQKLNPWKTAMLLKNAAADDGTFGQ